MLHAEPTSEAACLPRSHRRWPLALLATATLLYGIALFIQPTGFPDADTRRGADWLGEMTFRAYFQQSVFEFRQFPLWCPFLGGGYPSFAHPADDSLTPFSLPVLLGGEALGVKINLLLLTFLGVLGVFLLAREQLKMGDTGAVFSALAYLTAGWFPSMMLAGAYANAYFHLVPLILFLFFRAFRDWRYALPGGLLAALFGMANNHGGLLLFLFVFLLALGCSTSLPPSIYRLHGRAWPALTVLFLAAAGFGAVKFVGLHQLTRDAAHRQEAGLTGDEYRELKTTDAFYHGLGHFGRALLYPLPRQASSDERGVPQNDEYAWLGIPWLVLPMFLLGAWFRRRRSGPWLWAGLVLLILCFGPFAIPDLYRLVVWPSGTLRRIAPFYKYGNYFLLLVIVLPAGGALEEALGRLKRRWPRFLVTAAAFVSLAPFAYSDSLLLYTLFQTDLVQYPPADEFYQVKTEYNPDPEAGPDAYRSYTRPRELNAYFNLKKKIGTIDWYGGPYLAENAVPKYLIAPTRGTIKENPEYRGEAYFLDGRNRVHDVIIRANTIDVAAHIEKPGRLIVNQNYQRGWKSDQGLPAADNGLLSVEVRETGDRVIRFRFAPASFRWGLDITVLTFVLSLLAWRYGKPRNKPAAG